jgi:hypothetical protein
MAWHLHGTNVHAHGRGAVTWYRRNQVVEVRASEAPEKVAD